MVKKSNLLKSSPLLILILLLLTSPAKAGGYDEPITSSPDQNEPSVENIEQKKTEEKSVLDWNEWGKAYWSNNNQICRENDGNLACFLPEAAQQLHWTIPPQK
jgi:hypothetical protein